MISLIWLAAVELHIPPPGMLSVLAGSSCLSALLVPALSFFSAHLSCLFPLFFFCLSALLVPALSLFSLLICLACSCTFFFCQGNKRLFQQLLYLEMCQGRSVNEKMVENIFTQALSCASLSQNARHAFAQRRLQFLEEFGTDVSV